MATANDAGAKANTTINRLKEEGVITSDGNGGLRLTNELRQRIDREKTRVSTFEKDEAIDELSAVTSDTSRAERLFEACEHDDGVLAEYLALGRFDMLSKTDRLRGLILLNSLRGQPLRDEGAPEAFVPTDGNRLPLLLQMCECAIVYIWMEDCDPCDLMKKELNHIFEESPGEFGLFAVHGPSAEEVLRDRYQVDYAPVTLYFHRGEIDVRLQGAPTSRAIENEVDNLRALLE
jgi:hypothetical protein